MLLAVCCQLSVCSWAAFCSDSELARCVTELKPWLKIEAGSEQRLPLFLEQTPREIVWDLPPSPKPLPDQLNVTATNQAAVLRQALVRRGLIPSTATIYVESWPAMSDEAGLLTWSFARFSLDAASPRSKFEWLDDVLLKNMTELERTPFLPHLLVPTRKADFSDIFDDFLLVDDLYAKASVSGSTMSTRVLISRYSVTAFGRISRSKRSSRELTCSRALALSSFNCFTVQPCGRSCLARSRCAGSVCCGGARWSLARHGVPRVADAAVRARRAGDLADRGVESWCAYRQQPAVCRGEAVGCCSRAQRCKL